MRLWPKRRPRMPEVIDAIGPMIADALTRAIPAIPREITVNHTLPQPDMMTMRIVSNYTGRQINYQTQMLNPTASTACMPINLMPLPEEELKQGITIELMFSPRRTR